MAETDIAATGGGMGTGGTIAAVSTAAGISQRAIVRLSGPNAEAIVRRLLSDKAERRVVFRNWGAVQIELQAGEVRLPATVYAMRTPRSYTREDVFEIHTFGSPALAAAVLDAILRAGARAAGPGEFTRRAFLNGRIDLAQAEAVQAIVSAEGLAEVRAAQEALRGRLSGRIKALRDRLADVAALVELSLDFSDQDVEVISTDEIRERLLGVRDELTTLSACGERGRLPGHAVTAVLFGPPNAGKSSLFNALLRRHEAIVSPEPGTTRDVLEAELVAGAMRLRLIDTAGLHRPGSDVEAMAVGHSTDAIRSADVDLCVLDASRPPDRDGREALRMADPERTLLLLNKCDLNLAEETVRAAEGSGLTWLRVSSVTSEGLDALLEHMRERIGRDATYRHPDAVMLNARQFELLSAAIEAIRRVLDLATEETVGELAASDIHDALDAVSRITGDRVAEDILDRVFANFCIGK